MVHRLTADHYYDEPYGAGTHIVLLCLPDDLCEAAQAPYSRVASRMPFATFWLCRIASVADAESVQAIRFPQYRFVRNGCEKLVHTGLLDDAELTACFDRLED